MRARIFLGITVFALVVLAWTQRGRYTPVDAGSRAPAYSALTLQGDSFSVAAERGRVLVLNLWATWCKPCRAEMPALEQLHRQLGPRGLTVVGVSTDAAPNVPGPFGQPGGNVRAFVDELGLTFPIVHDGQRSIERLYVTQGLPTTFIIDKKGRIDRKVVGAAQWDDAEHIAYFEQLLSE